VLRYLLWRLLGVAAGLLGFALIAWLLSGGAGRALRGSATRRDTGASLSAILDRAAGQAHELLASGGLAGSWSARAFLIAALIVALLTGGARWRARQLRVYARLRIQPYRTDRASAEAVVSMFETLHKRLLRRWWRRVLTGQPSLALEIHHAHEDASRLAWFAVCCPSGAEAMVESALRAAYPNCRVAAIDRELPPPAVVLRLKKSAAFIKRVKSIDRFEHERAPAVNRLLTTMSACQAPALVQLALTPAPASFERLAKHLYKRHEARLARERREHLLVRDRSMVESEELRGALDVQHRPLFFADVRIVSEQREACERIASELRAEAAENRLVERGTSIRHGLFGRYRRRVLRGEGNPLPSLHKGVFASTELAPLWHLPSTDYMTVPLARTAVPLAPAPPAILRPSDGTGALRDALGPVSIHPHLRKQNTAVPGAVEQGKSSYLIATMAEDLRRARCAVIVLDPKGDAAEAALSLVPPERTCTLLDLANPTCGFNPLSVDAPADVIADYVVAALKNLFTDLDIRASSDRYLRNAIIAVLAFDRSASLWDAARLLSVGEEGYSYRRTVGARVRTLPEFKEISDFFTSELSAQLADARSMTTAKLDAPVNKLARLLNSVSIKRVLLNDSLRVDLDEVIAREQVLIVKGALGTMGAGNTSVVMQLLVGMLDAALARQQDLVPSDERVTVALKVDEAPLVLNRGFAETMALKRSAGLETVACWQTDAQWTDREVSEQLDALFAHRVYFATASARDARAAVKLMMAEFSDTVRPGIHHLSALGRPDVRLHLPKHLALASWTTPEGRQAPFIAQTVPLRVDPERIALHTSRQRARGGRPLTELRQPHWLRAREAPAVKAAAEPASVTPAPVGGDPSAAAAEGYGELVELDRASSVRWAKPRATPIALVPDELDLEVLALVASLRHVLTTQLHRRFNPSRALTTTQRRLKRLSDAGLLARFQFYRRDGGGVPMCHVATDAGRQVLLMSGRLEPPAHADDAQRSRGSGSRRDLQLRQARHDVHVTGWVLALADLIGSALCTPLGPDQAVLSPPARESGRGRAVLGPDGLRLPGGRTPHDFCFTDVTGERVEVEQFQTLRPDAILRVAAAAPDPDASERVTSSSGDELASRESAASTVEVQPPAVDVIVERDDRVGSPRWIAKLERYDHFLAGWSLATSRYGRRREALPVVVFVCREDSRARDCARRADLTLRACRAYAGEYPFDWEYPGRERVLFVSERDIYTGLLAAKGVPRLPPEVRVSAAHGDPRAGEASAEARSMPVWPGVASAA
jgi:Replication-relaxation